MSVDLSIVIPAYNEADRLPATLVAIAAYFARGPRRVEVIVVDDGSQDGTGNLSLPRPATTPNVVWRMLRNPQNRGKGYSVRRGMLESQGQRLLFTDADLSAPIEELPRLEAALELGADIAIGSRSRQELIKAHQSRFRENAGRIFNRMVRLILGLPFVDTQCGFKLFSRASAQAIFPQQRIERWGFDPELLFLARRYGFHVQEVPVVWAHAAGAKIRLWRDSVHMFVDVLAIRQHAGAYPKSPGLAQPAAQD